MKWAHEAVEPYGIVQGAHNWLLGSTQKTERAARYHEAERRFKAEVPAYERNTFFSALNFEDEQGVRTRATAIRFAEIACDVMYEDLLARGHIIKDTPGW